MGAFAWTSASSLDSALVESLTLGPYTAQITGTSGDTGVALAEIYDATATGAYTPASPRLINISARTDVGTGGDGLIAGFVIGGATSKTVLIRASGPALSAFGLSGVLADPQLQLYQSNGDGTSTLLEGNTGWGGPDRSDGSLGRRVFLGQLGDGRFCNRCHLASGRIYGAGLRGQRRHRARPRRNIRCSVVIPQDGASASASVHAAAEKPPRLRGAGLQRAG